MGESTTAVRTATGISQRKVVGNSASVVEIGTPILVVGDAESWNPTLNC